VPEVGDEVAGADDGLGLVDHAGAAARDGRHERLDEVVDLREVLAGRAHALPEEGHGVEPERLHAAVGEGEHGVEDGEEDLGVLPVQVPLVVVEGGPDPLAQGGVEGERARGLVGEDLGQRLLEGAGTSSVG
jgi:hypothetical protein